MNGALSPERMERLIDLAERMDPEKLDAGILSEASGCYPEEGCLQFVIDQIRKMNKSGYMDDIIEQLEDLQNELVGNGEYGREVIREYQHEVNKI